jgi:hypothetical protein
MAANIEAKFLKIVASGIVDKYIGESARLVREIFSMLLFIGFLFLKSLRRRMSPVLSLLMR